MTPASVRAGVALTLTTLTACGSGSGGGEAMIRDSAGIRIVEHEVATPAPAHWSADPAPVLEIGKTEGDDGYLLSHVRAASRLADGTVLVADWGSNDLRVFDSTGSLVRRFGRRGGGPGEFRALTWVGVSGTSVAAYDLILQRLSIFGADGSLRSTVPVPALAVGSSGLVVGRFPDGALLMQSSVGLPADPSQLPTGLVRDSLGLFLESPDGSSARRIGTFPGSELVRAFGGGVMQRPAPFGLTTVVALGDSLVYVGTQETFAIRGYDRDGAVREIIRRTGARPAVSPAVRQHWEQLHQEELDRLTSHPAPPFVMEVVRYDRLPTVLPAFGELRVDRLGNLWVGDYRPFPKEDSVTTWTVFGPDGALRARAELPAVTIAEIGADHVMGVWQDENGVPRVREYRLVKAAGPTAPR